MASKKQPVKPDPIPRPSLIEENKKLHLAILKQVVTLTTSGFGVVAALAWNSVIQELVNTYIKPYVPNSGLVSLLLYALLITGIAVAVTVNLSRIIDKLEQNKKELSS